MFCLLEARLWRISSSADELIKFRLFSIEAWRGESEARGGQPYDNTLHVYHNLNQNWN